ncbi:fungal-specific transcription factor domain-containing protein [Mycena rosella]|uniref:Fungal-specific transcription factor domain-containing protein n=1 Tax=Mycena rosella TaxID=1033263 RepID=A0AAD7CT58_MYCRO|nr:fungal-specific transcription factor domain-containing protein [Mycena rosella]
MPGGRCSHCIKFDSECTHANQTAVKAGSVQAGSPANLQTKADPPSLSTFPQDNSEAVVHVATIVTSETTAYILDVDVRQVLLDVAHYARHLEQELTSLQHSLSPPDSPGSTNQDTQDDDDDIFVSGPLAESFDKLGLESHRKRYFGKSSHIELLKTAMNVRQTFNDDEFQKQAFQEGLAKRSQFWRSPWEHADLAPKNVLPPLIFPDPDLLRSLVSDYFAKVNILLCLLHRPTFERGLSAGLHFEDRRFGGTVLAVCALAAKYSDDPRVLLEGTNTQLSAGWEYFRQLQLVGMELTHSITLEEVQLICLSVQYLSGSSVPEPTWFLGGAALRSVQEVGSHRRNRHKDKTLNEQWKRAYWQLICIDTLSSAFCGRPRATCSDDYDIDYPIECDDEYWETSESDMAFKQPPGKPSALSFTVAYVKLIEIMGTAQKTIYCVRKENKPEGWTQTVVAELDSALNAWVDAIPEHLRWDPHMQHPVFAAQSSALYACYYHVQIHVHRIFVVSAHKRPEPPIPISTSSNYPSLAICANAARACSHVMDVAVRRGFVYTPHVLNALCDAGVVLLLNVWGGRVGGLSTDPQKCLQDLETCLRLLGIYELRWQTAGRRKDTLAELLRATKIDRRFVPNRLKRTLDSLDLGLEDDYCGEPLTSDNAAESNHSAGAGVNHFPLVRPGLSSGFSIADIDPLFMLPKYTEDLGRLPVYEPFHWMKDPPVDLACWDENVDIGVGDPVSAGAGIFNGTHDWNEWDSNIINIEELVQALDGRNMDAHPNLS